jgi:uncharacterized membrane protein
MTQVHFTLGFRSLYCAVPLALYAAGPIVFLIATAGIALWMLYLDASTAV